ncbi:MAG: aminotransferase class IV [Deltaproteobacteria bacterium]|nr:aminotransferase class IV [Deltaproteobacteria bacterium]
MPDIAWLNGEFTSLAAAKVSINDRGYVFADGIYEVICTREGRPFLMEAHLRRFENSAAGLNLPLPDNYRDWPDIIAAGLEKAGYPETMIYIQMTRGVMPRRHDVPHPLTPQVVMTFRPKPRVDPAALASGQAAITVEEIRWSHCFLKTIALLPNVLMKQQARDQGCYEAIFVADDGEVHEGTAANVFFVRDGILYTPELGNYLLPGITRQYIIDQAPAIGLQVVSKRCLLPEMLAADEVFVTSTTVDAMPIVKIDNQPIGDGKPGPVTRKVAALFQ